MKAINVSPALIGRTIKVTDRHGLQVEGILTDLDVTVNRIDEGNLTRASMFGETITAYVTAIILNVAGHELRLHGHEHVTIIKDFLK